MGGKWPYSCYFVECCLQDLFNIACNILVKLPSSLFSIHLVSVHVMHPYCSIDTTTAWKKLRFILSVRQRKQSKPKPLLLFEIRYIPKYTHILYEKCHICIYGQISTQVTLVKLKNPGNHSIYPLLERQYNQWIHAFTKDIKTKWNTNDYSRYDVVVTYITVVFIQFCFEDLHVVKPIIVLNCSLSLAA